MVEMYKGMVNSPVAELTESISESATIIKVNNINAFPDAPNLATIGTEEDAETIMYAAKTDEALSGCQRGVQGVAKAWQTGDKIARNFTQKDHADLIDNVKEIKQKVDEAFQFASNGKQVISTAVTGKGVQASADDTFTQLSEKIGQIKKATGNATSSDVLAGKKFSNDDGTDITGTMKDNGRKIIRPSTSNIIIPKGFHDGTGYVEGDSDLAASNIVSGKNIFGVNGQALQYQQNEKTAIANALTSKGVPTSTTDSFTKIADNVRKIEQLSVADVLNKMARPTKRVNIPKSAITISEEREFKSGIGYSYKHSFDIEAKKNDIIFLYSRHSIEDSAIAIIVDINNKDPFTFQYETGCYLRETEDLIDRYDDNETPVLAPHRLQRKVYSYVIKYQLFVPNKDGRYTIDFYTKILNTRYSEYCHYFILKASEYLV